MKALYIFLLLLFVSTVAQSQVYTGISDVALSASWYDSALGRVLPNKPLRLGIGFHASKESLWVELSESGVDTTGLRWYIDSLHAWQQDSIRDVASASGSDTTGLLNYINLADIALRDSIRDVAAASGGDGDSLWNHKALTDIQMNDKSILNVADFYGSSFYSDTVGSVGFNFATLYTMGSLLSPVIRIQDSLTNLLTFDRKGSVKIGQGGAYAPYTWNYGILMERNSTELSGAGGYQTYSSIWEGAGGERGWTYIGVVPQVESGAGFGSWNIGDAPAGYFDIYGNTPGVTRIFGAATGNDLYLRFIDSNEDITWLHPTRASTENLGEPTTPYFFGLVDRLDNPADSLTNRLVEFRNNEINVNTLGHFSVDWKGGLHFGHTLKDSAFVESDTVNSQHDRMVFRSYKDTLGIAFAGYTEFRELAAAQRIVAGGSKFWAGPNGEPYWLYDSGTRVKLDSMGGSGHIIESNGTPVTPADTISFDGAVKAVTTSGVIHVTLNPDSVATQNSRVVIYSAYIEANTPTVTGEFNVTGQTATWSYQEVGRYRVTFSNPIADHESTLVVVVSSARESDFGSDYEIDARAVSTTQIDVYARTAGALSDDILKGYIAILAPRTSIYNVLSDRAKIIFTETVDYLNNGASEELAYSDTIPANTFSVSGEKFHGVWSLEFDAGATVAAAFRLYSTQDGIDLVNENTSLNGAKVSIVVDGVSNGSVMKYSVVTSVDGGGAPHVAVTYTGVSNVAAINVLKLYVIADNGSDPGGLVTAHFAHGYFLPSATAIYTITPFDSTALSNRINEKQAISDTGTYDATRSWVTLNFQQDSDTSVWDATRAWSKSGNILLNEIGNPTADKIFTMANRDITFLYTTGGSGDGHFEIEGTGNFSGDLVHIHQHTGNPPSSHLVHVEASDGDVVPFFMSGANDTLSVFTGGKSVFDSVIVTGRTQGTDAYFNDLFLLDDTSPSHYLRQTWGENEATAGRTLTWKVNGGDRTIDLSGNLSLPSDATISGTNTGDQDLSTYQQDSDTTSWDATRAWVNSNSNGFLKVTDTTAGYWFTQSEGNLKQSLSTPRLLSRLVLKDSLDVNTNVKTSMVYFPAGVVIDTLATRVSGGSSPSVTVKLMFGTDISATGTALITSPSATTSTTTLTKVSTFDNATIAGGNGMWLTVTAVSGFTNVAAITMLEIFLIGHYQ